MTTLNAGVPEDTTQQAETEAPAPDVGHADVEANPTDAAPVEPDPQPDEETPPPEYIDLDEYGNKFVRVKVDGEEQELPLAEALKGYNSNAAATKRFQEASRMREEAEQSVRLAQAVQNDPGLTMQVLARQQGLTVEQFLNLSPAQQEAAARQEPEPEFNDPLEKALYEERQARQRLEERFEQREQEMARQAADTQLRQAIGGLQTQYGATDEDARAVVAQAYQMGVGVEAFPMIYQAQQYQRMSTQNEARQEVQTSQAAQDAARQQAAAQASETVSSGTGAVGTAPQQVVRPLNAREAIEAALEGADF